MLILPYFSFIFYSFFKKWYHTIVATTWHVVSKYLLSERDGFAWKVLLEKGKLLTSCQEQVFSVRSNLSRHSDSCVPENHGKSSRMKLRHRDESGVWGLGSNVDVWKPLKLFYYTIKYIDIKYGKRFCLASLPTLESLPCWHFYVAVDAVYLEYLEWKPEIRGKIFIGHLF